MQQDTDYEEAGIPNEENCPVHSKRSTSSDKDDEDCTCEIDFEYYCNFLVETTHVVNFVETNPIMKGGKHQMLENKVM